MGDSISDEEQSMSESELSAASIVSNNPSSSDSEEQDPWPLRRALATVSAEEATIDGGARCGIRARARADAAGCLDTRTLRRGREGIARDWSPGEAAPRPSESDSCVKSIKTTVFEAEGATCTAFVTLAVTRALT